MAGNAQNLKPWAAGKSGNPKGRPPGRGQSAQFREALAKRLPAILDKLVELATEGDVQAIKLILDRTLPSIKPVEQTVELALPDVGATLTQQAQDVLAGMARGELAPGTAAQLVGAIGAVSKIAEFDELTARIEALEKAHAKP